MLPTDISRRNFLAKTGVVLTGLFLFSVKRTWAVCSGRQDCRACGARIKPEVADGVVCCPNCGREWQTGGFALKDAFEYRFRAGSRDTHGCTGTIPRCHFPISNC